MKRVNRMGLDLNAVFFSYSIQSAPDLDCYHIVFSFIGSNDTGFVATATAVDIDWACKYVSNRGDILVAEVLGLCDENEEGLAPSLVFYNKHTRSGLELVGLRWRGILYEEGCPTKKILLQLSESNKWVVPKCEQKPLQLMLYKFT